MQLPMQMSPKSIASWPKGTSPRTTPRLNSFLQERAVASPVPLTLANTPLASPKLVDQVFHSLMLAGMGLTFSEGLTPFAMVCLSLIHI